MKTENKILFLGLAVAILGCGAEKEQNSEISVNQNREEIVANNSTIGCNSEESKELEECTQNNSASLILEKLAEEDNSSKEIVDKVEEKETPLRGQLNTLLDDMSEDESKDNLESLVAKVNEIIENDSDSVAKDIENIVNSSYINDSSSKSIRDELIGFVDSIEGSKLNREEIESKLLSLVSGIESSKIKREEVESEILLLVGDAENSKKETRKNLESLVNSAEEDGTDESIRLASSIINDVATKKIKILRAEDKFIEIEVKAGDSLSALATKYYGDARKYKIIVEANLNKLKNKNDIYPGTKLIIPKLKN